MDGRARPLGPAEWIMLLTLSVIWGGSFFLNEIAVAGLPVLTVVALRVALAAAALWVVLLWRGRGLPRRMWGACLAMGLVNNVVPFTLTVWGQVHVASGTAAILNATTPLFRVVVAHFATEDERLGPLRPIGIAGVAAMVGGTALRELGSAVLGQLAILGAALSYAIAGVFGRRFAPRRTLPGRDAGTAPPPRHGGDRSRPRRDRRLADGLGPAARAAGGR